jgi:ribosome assembly protein SQT1
MSEEKTVDDVDKETKTVIIRGETLTEVEVSDEPPIDDDDSTMWTDDGNDDLDSMMGDDEENPDEPRPDIESVEMAVYAFKEHTDSVYCSAVHPQKRGLVITGGGDDVAYIWKYENANEGPESGNLISSHKLEGHTDTVTSVGFNFDGTLALTGAYDGTVRVWDVATGKEKLVLEGPEDVEWAEWHSKGNAIIAGSKDGTIWMWLAHNGQCVQVFAGHDGGVSSGCFTKDGKFVCSGGEDGSVRVWAPKNGQCKHVFEGVNGHEAMVTCMASSADGDLLLTGSVDGTVKLLQISGKKVLQRFTHSEISALPTPPTAGGQVGSIQPPGVPMNTIQEDEAGNNDEADDASMWEDQSMAGGMQSALSVECVGLSGGNYKWAASGGLDNTLKIWDITSGSIRSVCQHEGSVVALQWHGTLPIVATAALDHLVRLWDARAGSQLIELSGHTNLVTNLTFNALPTAAEITKEGEEGLTATDVIISVSDDKTARVFHVNANTLLT